MKSVFLLFVLTNFLLVNFAIASRPISNQFNLPRPPDIISSPSTKNIEESDQFADDLDYSHSSPSSAERRPSLSSPEVHKAERTEKPKTSTTTVKSHQYESSNPPSTDHPDDGELDISGDFDYVSNKVQSTKDKVLLIILDGLRSDLVEKNKRLKAFKFIAENGVKAKVKPVYPSQTYPNLYSIATGLYPNKHQMIANNMYSISHNELFEGTSASHPHWWNRAEPIWIRAARRGKRVAAYWVPGAEIELFGVKISQVEPYKDMVGNRNYDKMFSERLTTMVNAFRKNRLDFGLIRYEKIDAVGQVHGPQSREIKRVLIQVNKMLNQLIEEAQDMLTENLTIYIVSDHGIGPVSRQIYIDNYVDFNDIKVMVGEGAFSMLLPEEGKESFVSCINLSQSSQLI